MILNDNPLDELDECVELFYRGISAFDEGLPGNTPPGLFGKKSKYWRRGYESAQRKAASPTLTEEEEDRCFDQGVSAFNDDLSTGKSSDNPYDQENNHIRHEHWLAGYSNAQGGYSDAFEVLERRD